MPVTVKQCCWLLLAGSLAGVFSQVLQGVDTSREQAIKFLQCYVGPLMPQLLHDNEDAEQYFLRETKKVVMFDLLCTGLCVHVCLPACLSILWSHLHLSCQCQMVLGFVYCRC